MDEIIKEIIRIDSEAKAKLDEANRLKDEVVRLQIKQENDRIRQEMRDKMEHRLNMVRKTEEQYAQEKIRAIEAEKEKQLKTLDERYEKHHTAWEEELFQRITGR